MTLGVSLCCDNHSTDIRRYLSQTHIDSLVETGDNMGHSVSFTSQVTKKTGLLETACQNFSLRELLKNIVRGALSVFFQATNVTINTIVLHHS